MPSKKKRSRFSLLRDYKPAQWRESFLFITDKLLKIKIACIILWDFYDDEHKKCPYFIKKLSNEYNMYNQNYIESMICERELFLHLRKIGYPKRLARKRSFYRETEDDYEKNY